MEGYCIISLKLAYSLYIIFHIHKFLLETEVHFAPLPSPPPRLPTPSSLPPPQESGNQSPQATLSSGRDHYMSTVVLTFQPLFPGG